jgi:plasmid stability protein
VRTTIELPDDLFRRAKARAAIQGRALKDLVADGLKLLLQTTRDSPGEAAASRIPARKRASAGAWATRFAGVATPAPGETTGDARMDHYRKKYGV